MNELTAICGLPSVEGMSFEQLRGCMSYSQAFGLNATEWIVIAVAALLGMRVAVFGHKKPLAALEGLLYAPLAAYGGMVGGLLFAQWMRPWMMGVWLIFVAAAAIFLLCNALWKGNASAGWKVLGSIELGVLLVGFVTVAALCLAIPEDNAADAYQRYLSAVSWLFTGAAIVDVLFAATYGSYHWAIGWLLIPLNGSWGALGNLTGIIHHTLSWNCFANQGDIEQENRKFYTKYKNGLRMRYAPAFAFTQAAVMSTPPVEKHESQHVLQHFIFGPMFTVSYVVWMVPAAIVGLIVGLIKGKGFAGIEAWAYYNNPWEIWAYKVDGGRSQNGDTSLIWGPIASWIVSIVFWVIVVGLFLTLLVLRH